MSEAGLAAQTVAALVSCLAQAGGSVITTAARDLYQWVKGKLPGKVERLEKTPEDKKRQNALEVDLEDLLNEKPQLAAELRPLVEKAEMSISQDMRNTGKNSINTQVGGSGNTTTITRNG